MKDKPQQKGENKIPYFTWTKKWGRRLNGYIKTDKNEK